MSPKESGMSRMLFPIGIQTFSEIRENGLVYVDKTEYIHNLVSTSKYIFLSRPRRFGKSILLSTIKAFFEGRRELFEGLAIAEYEHDWEPHPVLHFDFSGNNYNSFKGFESQINRIFTEFENKINQILFVSATADYSSQFAAGRLIASTTISSSPINISVYL